MATILDRSSVWLLIAALLGGLAVGFGAFGAHGLESRLKEPDGTLTVQSQRKLANWETAARYQMYHALALLGISCMLNQRRSSLLSAAAAAMTAGTLLFSGSLYLLVLTNQRIFIAVVPLGGLIMLAGWLILVIAAAWQFRTTPT